MGNKYTSGFTILGHIITALSVIGWIVIFIITPFSFLLFVSMLSDIFIICLVYGLGEARTKIAMLEDVLYSKKIVHKKDFEVIEKKQEKIPNEIPNVEGLTYCKKCGYQIFPDEKACSYCGTQKELD